MWYRIPGILHSLPSLHIFLVITKRALASWSNWEFYEQKLQIMHFLQNWNLPVNAMIFGPTRKLSGSFHVSLNKLPKGWMVIGDLMSHAYWYKSMRFIEVTCVLVKIKHLGICLSIVLRKFLYFQHPQSFPFLF